MDDSTPSVEAFGHTLQGPHWHRSKLPETGDLFVPLELVPQPGSDLIVLNHAENVVGRHSEADVRLPPPDVSRRHCRIVFVHGTWQVLDLKSLNGVFVNGERVQQATLRHGDVLRIASCLFRINLETERIAGQSPEDISGRAHGMVRSIAAALDDPASSFDRRAMEDVPRQAP